ncbi:MAG: class II glutamine amidotransferase [Myxococcales bacterium FL481]|nr:MAG: class II glutamine amidotransferase [Myxococcales bacterium FL481]
MCRLFGFRSRVESRVHKSLISADNALIQQSDRHPDGWGVAYFVDGAPHVIKSTDAAGSDQLFHRVSGVATSDTVLAHLRKATQGGLTIVNTHPFQYGRWVFAHNGNVANFAALRPALLARIAPDLRRYILGRGDSEVLFYSLLTRLQQRTSLGATDIASSDLAAAAREAIADLCGLAGPSHPDDSGPPDRTYLTFLLTNGEVMLAHQGGKSLFVSTHKTVCSERANCPEYRPSCEAPVQGEAPSHLLFSSEPLQGENAWDALEFGEIAVADRDLQLIRVPAHADLAPNERAPRRLHVVGSRGIASRPTDRPNHHPRQRSQ